MSEAGKRKNEERARKRALKQRWHEIEARRAVIEEANEREAARFYAIQDEIDSLSDEKEYTNAKMRLAGGLALGLLLTPVVGPLAALAGVFGGALWHDHKKGKEREADQRTATKLQEMYLSSRETTPSNQRQLDQGPKPPMFDRDPD